MAVRVKKKPRNSKPKIKPAGQKKHTNKRKPVWKPKPGVPSRFPKGTSGNPNGRPKGCRNRFSIAELADAIKKVEKSKRKGFMEEWIRCSWGNSAAMDAIMHYMLPKLKSIEGALGLFEVTMDDELAKSIQDKLKERYV